MGGAACCAEKRNDAVDSSKKVKLVSKHEQLKIIHFNDVYNIESQEHKGVPGGAGRFVTAVNALQKKIVAETEAAKNNNGPRIDQMTCFLGDLLGPSTISTQYEGSQIIYPYNRLKVDVAMIGNHDLDYGVNRMMQCIDETRNGLNRCLDDVCVGHEKVRRNSDINIKVDLEKDANGLKQNLGEFLNKKLEEANVHKCEWLCSNIVEKGKNDIGIGGLP